jgi:UDP-N-acetylglucosamine 2-epimerase (non-hydrolysing)
MKKIISVVGARPNFMKVAPLHRAFLKYSDKVQHLICHTGQHYDENMSKIFFDDLELPKPDFYLGVGSGSHAEQTGRIMIEFEKILLEKKPDLIVVVGDVNSTIACTLTAAKLHIKTAHVEAGLRSFDRKMPEELNRLLTDQISDFLFVTEKSGLENLKKDGIPDEKVFFVGNVMIDSLAYFLSKAQRSDALEKYNLGPSNYVLVTLHRPSNVDSKEQLDKILNMLNSIAQKRKIIFPIHPRTKSNIDRYSLLNKIDPNVILCDPIGYIDFLNLLRNSELVITDSGGIQEETTYLGVQCITVRESTERPITVEIGTNHLVGNDFKKAEITANNILNGSSKKGTIPNLWDGKAAERISEIIVSKLNNINN